MAELLDLRQKHTDFPLGEFYDSRTGIDLSAPNTVNVDETRGGVPSYITLAHELFHAQSNGRGTNDRTRYQLYDFDTNSVLWITAEEVRSRINENIIRQEHNLIQRAIPIPTKLNF